jgi:hypothetical protein
MDALVAVGMEPDGAAQAAVRGDVVTILAGLAAGQGGAPRTAHPLWLAATAAVRKIKTPALRTELAEGMGLAGLDPVAAVGRLLDAGAPPEVVGVLGMTAWPWRDVASGLQVRLAEVPLALVRAMGFLAAALPDRDLPDFRAMLEHLGLHPLSVGAAGADHWKSRRALCVRLGAGAWADGITQDRILLDRLPEGFRIAPLSLAFREPAELAFLPDGLTVGGGLELRGASLRALPRGLVVTGGLQVMGCPNLAEVPEDLRVGQTDLWDCPSLVAMPDAQYGWTLDIRHCARLEAFPRVLEAPAGKGIPGAWGFLDDCPSLTRVRGGAFDCLSVHGCPKLEALGAGMRVARHLWVEGCQALVRLEDGLEVGWWSDDAGQRHGAIEIQKCPSFKTLPDRLDVGGHVWVLDCGAFAALPRELRAGRFVDVEGCPAWDGRLPPAEAVGWALEPDATDAGA